MGDRLEEFLMSYLPSKLTADISFGQRAADEDYRRIITVPRYVRCDAGSAGAGGNGGAGGSGGSGGSVAGSGGYQAGSGGLGGTAAITGGSTSTPAAPPAASVDSGCSVSAEPHDHFAPFALALFGAFFGIRRRRASKKVSHA
jgi:MYXO-CTERM domain-containing protein